MEHSSKESKYGILEFEDNMFNPIFTDMVQVQIFPGRCVIEERKLHFFFSERLMWRSRWIQNMFINPHEFYHGLCLNCALDSAVPDFMEVYNKIMFNQLHARKSTNLFEPPFYLRHDRLLFHFHFHSKLKCTILRLNWGRHEVTG